MENESSSSTPRDVPPSNGGVQDDYIEEVSADHVSGGTDLNSSPRPAEDNASNHSSLHEVEGTPDDIPHEAVLEDAKETEEKESVQNEEEDDVEEDPLDSSILYQSPLVLYKRNNPVLRRRSSRATNALDPTEVSLPNGKVGTSLCVCVVCSLVDS